MGYTVQRIRLGKKEADSTFYNADVNDAKMQEIAAALGMKLNIVESNTTWILYMGDDEHNTTGFKFSLSGANLIMTTVIQGATPSASTYCYSYNMSLTRSANSGAANAFCILYHAKKEWYLELEVSARGITLLIYCISYCLQKT